MPSLLPLMFPIAALNHVHHIIQTSLTKSLLMHLIFHLYHLSRTLSTMTWETRTLILVEVMNNQPRNHLTPKIPHPRLISLHPSNLTSPSFSAQSLYLPPPQHPAADQSFSSSSHLLISALKLKVKVAQSCLILCDPIDYTVYGIL